MKIIPPFGPQIEEEDRELRPRLDLWVVEVTGVSPPSLHSFSSIEKMVEFLRDSVKDGERWYYPICFEPETLRGIWRLTKGRIKKLLAPDGKSWVLNPDEISDEVDESFSLSTDDA